MNRGDKIVELYLIMKGKVFVSPYKKLENEFLILKESTILGDYQIIFDYKCTECYNASDEGEVTCLYLKKRDFLGLLSNYPDADKYYKDRA